MKNYQDGFSVIGIIESFKNSARGFKIVLQDEYNLYIQIGFAIIATICGFIFEISFDEWAIQTAVIGLVIFSELVNTAFEKTMDLIHPQQDPRVRDIKDLASAAVLFMVMVSITTGLFIYVPKVIVLL